MTPQKLILSCLNEGVITTTKSGTVFSKNWKKSLGCRSSRGYLVCSLVHKGIKKQVKIHQIVWMSFNGAIPSGLVIDHINGNKLDNSLENLRLVTNKENSQNRRSYVGENNPAAKINKQTADKIRKEHSTGWSYSALATHFKICKTLVAKIIRGELWN